MADKSRNTGPISIVTMEPGRVLELPREVHVFYPQRGATGDHDWKTETTRPAMTRKDWFAAFALVAIMGAHDDARDASQGAFDLAEEMEAEALRREANPSLPSTIKGAEGVAGD